ncbi:MAG: dihydrofolate reductase [Sphaerochaetaceae bacterium]|nr:dihydrofolate reductase [Sphaerochaetaceae bacterium]
MQAILHCDNKWGIGKNGTLMFSIPKDMKFFRATTLNKVVVMGARTLDSFPNGKPLKKRVNIVLSTTIDQKRAQEDDFILVRSMEDLFAEIRKYKEDEVFVIGGAKLYKALLPYTSKVLVTKVDADGGADTFFTNLDLDGSWKLTEESEAEEDNGYTIRFCTYENQNLKSF